MNTSGPEQFDKVRFEDTNIINSIRRGTVPAGGLEKIAVGLGMEEDVIGKQLDYVASGGGDLKFIRGDYGSGKTFIVARALEIARQKGFVTSYIVISPQNPLTRIKSVYHQICTNIRTPAEEHALKTIIDNWLYAIEERVIGSGGRSTEEGDLEEEALIEVESALATISRVNSSLSAAIRTYYHANNAGEFSLAQAALGWISGEAHIGREFKQKAGIRGILDENTALLYISGLVKIILGAGYSGLALGIDELDTTQMLQRPQREKAYNLIYQFIDSLDRGDMPNCYLLFTATPSFFEGPRGIRALPPLVDRISIVNEDGFKNPRQPQIILERFNAEKLGNVAVRVLDIYGNAYSLVDRERVSHRFIRAMVQKLTKKFGGRVDVIPRIFLKEFVDVLDKCELYEHYNPWDAYEFDPERIKSDLKEEEEAVMVIEV